MEKQRITFIVNPISGTQSKKSILEMIDKYVDRNKYDFEVTPTQFAGHAIELASIAAAEGAFMVVAIGGDGTINEIGRSLVHTKTALGIIPCGSGNGERTLLIRERAGTTGWKVCERLPVLLPP